MTEGTRGGYENDLRNAENAMIAAGHPEVALEMRRHSEAIRNYMQGAIVPMFVEMVERVLGEKIDPLGTAIKGLRKDVQRSAAETARRLGKQDDDIAALAVRVAALEASSVRLEALEVAIAALRRSD